MGDRTVFEQNHHWQNATTHVFAAMKRTEFESETAQATSFVQEMIASQANLLAQMSMDRTEISRLMNVISELNDTIRSRYRS